MQFNIDDFLGLSASVYIIALTIFLSFIAFCSKSVSHKLMLKPYELTRNGGYYTLVTSGFIHGDFGHLFFNLLTFFFFAFHLEGILGSMRFLILYIFSMVFSLIWTIIRHRNDSSYGSLGASGAITGVMFSYILYEPDRVLIAPYIPVPVPAMIYVVIYVVYCLFQSMFSKDNVNHDAHLWGGVGGVLITLVLDPLGYTRLMNLWDKILSFMP